MTKAAGTPNRPKQRRYLQPTALVVVLTMLMTSCTLFTRVSQTSSGGPPDAATADLALSSDGRYAVFTTAASNMTGADTNSHNDIYLRDNQAGTTELISVSTTGDAGNASSTRADISGDGRYVVFRSAASDLVANDTNGITDIFLRDRQTGSTELVSVASNGTQANSSSNTPSVSDDGRFVAFASFATNLYAFDVNGVSDIVVKDRLNGLNTPVSRASNPTGPTDSASLNPTMAADGSTVVYESYATNIVGGDANGELDVFTWDRVSRINTLVSWDDQGGPSNGPSRKADVSVDGSFIAFESRATDLTPGDTNGHRDIFLYEASTQTTQLITVDTFGGPTNFPAEGPAVSDDGSRVAFHSSASDLVANDTNGLLDVFVWDAGSGIERVSVTTSFTTPAQSNGSSTWPDLSDDGQSVGFVTAATNVSNESGGTNNGVDDIVVRAAYEPRIASVVGELEVGSTRQLVFTGTNFAPDAYVFVTGGGTATTISQTATELVVDVNASGNAGPRDLWVVNRQPQLGQQQFGSSSKATVATNAAPIAATLNANNHVAAFDLSNRYVVFETKATNIIAGDTNGASDIFRFDPETGTTELVSSTSNGSQFTADSINPTVSDDGRYVSFETESTNGTTTSRAIWLKDMQSGSAEVIVSQNCTTDGGERAPHIAGGGDFIVFRTGWNGCGIDHGIMRYERTTTALDWVTVNTAGQPANNGNHVRPSISADGNTVSAELRVNQSWVYDLTVAPSSANYATLVASGTFTPRPWISGDGATIAYRTVSQRQPAAYDIAAGSGAQVVFDQNGATIDNMVGTLDLSNDGTLFALRVTSNDMNHAVGLSSGDQYVHDTTTNTLRRIGNGQYEPKISPDGACAAVREYGNDLWIVDVNGGCGS